MVNVGSIPTLLQTDLLTLIIKIMKPLTTKQRQAITRGRAMFQIKGAIANLRSVKDNYFRSYVLKGMINSAIITLERLLEHMKSSRYSSYETYLNDFYSNKKEENNE